VSTDRGRRERWLGVATFLAGLAAGAGMYLAVAGGVEHSVTPTAEDQIAEEVRLYDLVLYRNVVSPENDSEARSRPGFWVARGVKLAGLVLAFVVGCVAWWVVKRVWRPAPTTRASTPSNLG
jgi:hypothetical protein